MDSNQGNIIINPFIASLGFEPSPSATLFSVLSCYAGYYRPATPRYVK
ncbi:hypothetical protein [Lactococcus lactis]